MALYIHCPNCHERLEVMKVTCTRCDAALPPGVLYALSAALDDAPLSSPMQAPGHIPAHLTPPPAPAPAPTPPLAPPPVSRNSALRPWLAAALSLLCGLGQLYNGQVAKGIILIIFATIAVVYFRLPAVKIMLPVLWLYAIIDAYMAARRANA